MSQINGALKVAQSDGGGRCSSQGCVEGSLEEVPAHTKGRENFPEEGYFIFGLVDK